MIYQILHKYLLVFLFFCLLLISCINAKTDTPDLQGSLTTSFYYKDPRVGISNPQILRTYP